jgi:hypothetical protein
LSDARRRVRRRVSGVVLDMFFFGHCCIFTVSDNVTSWLIMETFRPNRSLLNPKFEGYKLLPIQQENVVIRHDLVYKPTQSTISTKSPLSFHEVRSRITHNHLCISSEGRRALYVDADYNVVLVDVDLVSSSPRPYPSIAHLA